MKKELYKKLDEAANLLVWALMVMTALFGFIGCVYMVTINQGFGVLLALGQVFIVIMCCYGYAAAGGIEVRIEEVFKNESKCRSRPKHRKRRLR